MSGRVIVGGNLAVIVHPEQKYLVSNLNSKRKMRWLAQIAHLEQLIYIIIIRRVVVGQIQFKT